MADKRIQDLTPASQVQTSDRFVLEQSGQAKSLTGQILINDLATYLDGHGGINDIVYTEPLSGELDGTLTITLADETEETFTVTNGRGIYNIAKTDTQGLVDEYTIYYNNDTTSTFSVTNGEKGDTGDNWYVHIKWSATEPTQDSDMSDTPNNWIGIYAGVGSTAPTSYSSYTWFEYKGETGDTGNGISSISIYSSSGTVDTYQVLFTNGTTTTFTVTNGSSISSITKTSTVGLVDTYTVTLTNGDSTTFTVTNAKSITTITPPGNPGLPGQTDRYTINYNNGDTSYFDVYNGTNGTGSVSAVDGIAPINSDVPTLLFGSGAPTVDTPGVIKQRYFDTLNNLLYICVDVDDANTPVTYTWRGSSVTVDSALSSVSTNPVQNAVLTALLGTTPLDTTAQTLTSAVNELNAEMLGFADNIADPYDATATYAVNDLCIHDNTLYRCNTAITTAEAWNSIHWTQTTVDEDKVSKSGDTMNATLEVDGVSADNFIVLKSTDADTTVAPQSATAYSTIRFSDKNGTAIGFVRARHFPDGKRGLWIYGANDNGAGNVLGLYIDNSGNREVVVSDATVWRNAIGAVNIAGDTMTGDLTNTSGFTIKHPTASYTNPPSTASSILYTAKDSTSSEIAQLRSQIKTNGAVQTYLNARRVVSGSAVFNGISFEISSDGTRTVGFDYPQGVRSALGLGTSGALPITIAQGGTGQTAVTTTTTISDIATAASGVTISEARFTQWGKTATIRIKFKKSSAISSYTTICTLATGKRPYAESGATIQVTSGHYAVINTSGTVAVSGSFSANTDYILNATYILA